MVIRKGKLWRSCRKCGESFEPTGRASRLCDNCNKSGTFIRQMVKLQQKVNVEKPARIVDYLDETRRHRLAIRMAKLGEKDE